MYYTLQRIVAELGVYIAGVRSMNNNSCYEHGNTLETPV